MATLAEKILAVHCGKKTLTPGEFVNARPDVVMANDITAPISINEFRRFGLKKVFDPKKIVFICDHCTPNKDIISAENSKQMRDFAKEFGVQFYDVGVAGIEHAFLPEQGIILPGELLIGADSHTVTYGALGAFSTGMGSTEIAAAMATGDIWMKVPESIKFIYRGKPRKWVTGKDFIIYTIGKIGVDGARYASMEFTGEGVDALSMDDRFTMSNMAIEAGGKAGIFRVDAKTQAYVKARAKRPYKVYEPDTDAQYAKVYEWDISKMEPQVAFPHIPSNAKPISQASKMNIAIDQAVIGSCTNGRLSDLQIAASILKGKKIHPYVRCIVIPATPQIYLDALTGGLIETFIKSGCAVSTPTCGPCFGGHMGCIAAGERSISTTNRNFIGRMGSNKAEVYLASPAVAAASAITGKISSPEEVMK
ncbi:MAG: 3-isopropylmalate dehydratase large subunit [Chloroflexota bacterium]